MRKKLRLLCSLVCADLRERTRRSSFLITLAAMVYAGFLALPSIDSGALTVDLGNLRGAYNSAWVGSMIALLSTMLISLPGFYLVKNAIALDRETGVGQIVATTPLGKFSYVLGKTFSNLIFLTVIMGVVLIAAGATQLLRAESSQLDLWALVAPFLFVSLPALVVVSAVAVLFETVPGLKGGFGNIAYLFLYLFVLVLSLSSVQFSQQGVMEKPVNDIFGASLIGLSMQAAAHAAFPERILDFGIGYTVVRGPIETFTWEGVEWTPPIVLSRLVWVGVALALAVGASCLFRRFDTSTEKTRNKVGKTLRSSSRPTPWSLFSRLPLFPFARLWLAELELALAGRSWMWALVLAGLVVTGASSPVEVGLHSLLPVCWLWPVLVWSGLGGRENRFRTGSVVFSAPYTLRRQLPALWLAGVSIAFLAGSGVAFRLLLAHDWPHLYSWMIAVLFIPSLALACGTWTGGCRFFEALYALWWYLGPVSGFPPLDFMGISDRALSMGIPFIYLAAALLLLGLSFGGRAFRLRTS